jgi:hypothetical protein
MTTNKKTDPISIKAEESPEDQIQKLEGQVLSLRRLHANALQMLVTMGRDLLHNQQMLLNAVSEMRTKYEVFARFIEENSAHLPKPPEAQNDAANE